MDTVRGIHEFSVNIRSKLRKEEKCRDHTRLQIPVFMEYNAEGHRQIGSMKHNPIPRLTPLPGKGSPPSPRTLALVLFFTGVFAAIPMLVFSLSRIRFTWQFALTAICWLLAILVDIGSPLLDSLALKPSIPAPAGVDGLAALLILAMLVPTGLLFHRGLATRAGEEFRIVVAEFTGPDPDRYPVSATLAGHLEGETRNQRKVRVIRIKSGISEDLGSTTARVLLNRYHADMVIWGWYGPAADGVLVGMHVLLSPEGRRISGTRRRHARSDMRPVAIPLPGRFTLQSRWEIRCRDLALFACGLSHYLQSRSDQAISEWTTALRFAPPSRNGMIALFRGNAYASTNRRLRALRDSIDAVSRAPQLPEAWNQQGVSQAMGGDRNKALESLENAGRLDPDWTIPHCNQAVILAAAEDWTGAAAALAIARQRDPDNPDVLFNRGIMSLTRSRWPEAIRDFSRVVEMQPGEGDAWYFRGICRFHHGDPAGAREDLTRSIRLLPTWARALHDLGVIHARMGNLFMAIRDFTRALARRPDRLDTRRQRAAALYLTGDFDQAAGEYSRILKTHPNDDNALTDRGKARFRMGDLLGAERDFSTLIQRDPEVPNPLIFRGKVYLGRADSRAAEADFARALALDPENPHAWTGRALARTMQQRLPEAMADLKNALARGGDRLQLWLMSGIINRQMQRHRQAEADFIQASRLAPRSPEPIFQLGLTFFQAGKIPDALEQFNRVMEISPFHHEALHFRGVSLLISGEMQAATRDLRKAAELVPEEAAYRLSLANAFLIEGQSERAAREYLAGGRLVPHDPIPAFFAGQALEGAGRLQAALDLYTNTLGRADSASLPMFQALKRRIRELQRDIQRMNPEENTGSKGKRE